MICNFLRASPLQSIIKPFVGTLIRTLPLNADIRLTTASLEAVGELCMVVRDDIYPYGDQLLPQIITSMYDNSSKRKQEIDRYIRNHPIEQNQCLCEYADISNKNKDNKYNR